MSSNHTGSGEPDFQNGLNGKLNDAYASQLAFHNFRHTATLIAPKMCKIHITNNDDMLF